MPSYNMVYKKLQDGVNTVSTKRHQHFKKCATRTFRADLVL